MDKKLFIKCAKCGYHEEVNKKLFAKVLGGIVSGFGYWAWVSFLFAGTGFAMPICVAIMAGGLAMVAFADQIVGWLNKRYPCPTCGQKLWKTVTYDEMMKDKEIKILRDFHKQFDSLIQGMEQNTSNERLDVDQLRETFHAGINHAKEEIDIYAPNLGGLVFGTEDFKQEIYRALQRGCLVKIRCGYMDKDDEKQIKKMNKQIKDFVTDERFKKYYDDGRLRFKVNDSHAKLFIVDEEFYILSSMNFLSNPGTDMLYNGKVRHQWEELGEKSNNIDNLLAYRGKYFSF